MKNEWYYIENDETIGPTTLDDLAERIRRAGQSQLVWTVGMTEWTDAKAVPALSRLLRAGIAQPLVATADSAGLVANSASKATFLQRLRDELIEYFIISSYLFVCFGSLLFYKATILQSNGIAYASLGIAAVKALILGKFILVLHALKVGELKGAIGVLFADILKKSVLFLVILTALTVAEEIIVGYFHGRSSHEVLSEMTGGTLPQPCAVSILMLLILVPYFTVRGIADRLGDGVLWKLLSQRSSSASTRAAEASRRNRHRGDQV